MSRNDEPVEVVAGFESEPLRSAHRAAAMRAAARRLRVRAEQRDPITGRALRRRATYLDRIAVDIELRALGTGEAC